MSTSIASQLQAIRSLVRAESEPLKRPFTRPSILFNPKDAADIDIESILGIALAGLEALALADERFRNYKNDLFSHRSRELDRELLGRETNDRINASISTYLRLLAGYLHLPASLKTLEYLIRRYKVHVYNMEDLILCSLPYHDTHAFVRIIQILNPGNSKWKFLDGIKTSGAPPPRSLIVQQCLRDMGVLEDLCEYASRTKKFQPSRPVISFCTAVIVDVLGSVKTVDSDIVKRILPFVDSGLQPGVKGGSDHQAAALMIVGLLANKTTLNPSIVKRFIRSVAEIAGEYAKQDSDLQWLRVSFMALINFVQLQSVNMLPKKALDILKEIRDIAGVLSGLSKDFNIDRFLMVLLDSLVDNSSCDDTSLHALTSIIEVVPISSLVEDLVLRVFSSCIASSQRNRKSGSSSSGGWGKKILVAINKSYHNELRRAVLKFLEDNKVHSKKEDAMLEMLCNMLDGNLDISLPFSESSVWFRLHHPKAAVRRATLSNLNTSNILKIDATDSQSLVTIQDAILQQLWDDDLAVVQAALSLNRLSEIIHSSDLLEALHHVTKRCISILTTNTPENIDLVVEVITCSLKVASSSFHNQADYMKRVASMMFPFLLLQPKTLKLFFNILELAKETSWPFFKNLATFSVDEMEKNQQLLVGGVNPLCIGVLRSYAETLPWNPDECRPELMQSFCNFKLSELLATRKDFKLAGEEHKKLLRELRKRENLSSFNMEMVSKLAETFVLSPSYYMPWLIESCSDFASSKTLFFLVLMQSVLMRKSDSQQLVALFEVCFPILKDEWEALGSIPVVSLKELLICKTRELLYQLFDSDINTLNAKILICLFWTLLEAFVSIEPPDLSSAIGGKLVAALNDVFVFFASSRSKHVFSEHFRYLVRESKVSPVRFLSRFFTEEDIPVAVQCQSLQCFAYLCSEEDSKWVIDVLAEFPSVLVPLSSDKHDVRIDAMACVEGLQMLWRRVDFSSKKNGNAAVWSHFLDDLLGLMTAQRQLILSDQKFLPSLLASLIGSSRNSLLVPRNIHDRFDQSTKDKILSFILGSALKLPAYGKIRILSLLKSLGSAMLQIKDIESLLCLLLRRRNQYYFELDKSCQKLSDVEIQLLCLLLECSIIRSPSEGYYSVDDHLLKPLQMDCMFPEDPAVVRPCLTVLQKLGNEVFGQLEAKMQDCVFRELVFLFRSTNSDIQNAAREALLRLKISCSTMCRMLGSIIQRETLVIETAGNEKKKRRKKKSTEEDNLEHDVVAGGEKALSFVSSLLDILLMKKDVTYRESLIGPLFKLLGRSLLREWVHITLPLRESLIQASSGDLQSISNTICYIQQTLLLVLRDICDSLINRAPLKIDIANEINVKLLVEFVRSLNDGVTRNHVFSLLSSITKVVPENILEHIVDILKLVGESTVTQLDRHSQHVFEDFISTVVPVWVTKTDSPDEILQIFVEVLPDVGEHRRLSIVIHLLRTLGERNSLAPLLLLLFDSLVSRKSVSWLDASNALERFAPLVEREWEYAFAVQICQQYATSIWLPSLVMLLQLARRGNPSQFFAKLWLMANFILQKLHDPDFAFKLESQEDSGTIQRNLEELMEGVISLLQSVDTTAKQIAMPPGFRKEMRIVIHTVLRTITMVMTPAAYFKGIINLLQMENFTVQKKALGLLTETAKDAGTAMLKSKGRRARILQRKNLWVNMDELALESFGKMCLKIAHIIDGTLGGSSTSLKLSAASTLEVLAGRFPANHPVLATCLTSVAESISSKNLAVSSACLRTSAALINVVGPRALAELPRIMKNLMSKSREISSQLPLMSANNDATAVEESVMLSILVTLEAAVDKLGGFLNPYLVDIVELMVLRPEFVSESYQKFKVKADTVRKLLTEKIPVRLALQPLMKIYDLAVNCGDSSLAIAFEMVTHLIGRMDRSFVGGYHGKIFDLCLLALDIRRQQPASVLNIDVVERSILNTMVALTMKLTESMFKPLFIRSIEWAESEIDDKSGGDSKSIERAISLYGLVNKLAENHRSLFVPYFKYLLEACVNHLSDVRDVKTSNLTRKKKKAKIQEATNNITGDTELTIKSWHLRALILSSLHKCFLYDAGNVKFLDSNNFQVLLKPTVSQLVVEPPVAVDEHPQIPSVQEVDDLLVATIGQMAVTAGSDLLWKPLNHEVLMQTRSEKIRARMLGLRIVKQFLENLNEEYLVLLAETIPFLGELLEDAELAVKSLAQEVLKQMEEMSGESLSQYL